MKNPSNREWFAILDRLRKYIDARKGNYTKIGKEVGIPLSTLDNYLFKSSIPSFPRGRLLQKFSSNLKESDLKSIRKGGIVFKGKKKKTHYQMLKESGQLK